MSKIINIVSTENIVKQNTVEYDHEIKDMRPDGYQYLEIISDHVNKFFLE